VKHLRGSLGFHTEMGHYNLTIGGAVFEWAKDLGTNEMDIVFALDPEPLIAAGLDPEAVEGWTYKTVPATVDGQMVEVYKLLKAFHLK